MDIPDDKGIVSTEALDALWNTEPKPHDIIPIISLAIRVPDNRSLEDILGEIASYSFTDSINGDTYNWTCKKDGDILIFKTKDETVRIWKESLELDEAVKTSACLRIKLEYVDGTKTASLPLNSNTDIESLIYGSKLFAGKRAAKLLIYLGEFILS